MEEIKDCQLNWTKDKDILNDVGYCDQTYPSVYCYTSYTSAYIMCAFQFKLLNVITDKLMIPLL